MYFLHLDETAALGAQNNRLSVERLDSLASEDLARSLPEVMMEEFTPLFLKFCSWTSIRAVSGDSTSTALLLQGPARAISMLHQSSEW